MRRFLVLGMVIGLALVSVAQNVWDVRRAVNLDVPGGPVAPGEVVTAQEIIIGRGTGIVRFAGSVLSNWNWDIPENALEGRNYTCATTSKRENALYLQFNLNIPSDAIVKWIGVDVFGTQTPAQRAMLWVRLESGSDYYEYREPLPPGECGAGSITLGEDLRGRHLWDRQWTPEEINSLRVRLRAEFTDPGREVHVHIDAVKHRPLL